MSDEEFNDLRALIPPRQSGDPSHVQWFQERIERQIASFQKHLNHHPPQRYVLASVILPSGREIEARWFGYHGPDMLVVEGFDEGGRECRVLAPQTSVHILLTAVAPSEPEKARPTIGFQDRPKQRTP